MIKLIAGVSQNGVLGKNNSIPWSYPDDIKFFRRMTLDSTIIMGRNTFESMGSKPLPKRRNIVITSGNTSGPLSKLPNVETFGSVEEALTALDERSPGERLSNPDGTPNLRSIYTTSPIWFIGGRRIYQEGLKYASQAYLTLIPENVSEGSLDDLVYFPWIDVKRWSLKSIAPIENADGSKSDLEVAVYKAY